MTFEEWELLPRKPGWKYEYWDGEAHISPAHILAPVRIAVGPRPVDASFSLEPVTRDAESGLVRTFVDVFRHTIEYCNWDMKSIRESATSHVREYFEGRRGQALQASRLATCGRMVIGAVLVVRLKGKPILDLLLVRASWRRQGLATALVSAVLNDLHGQGEKVLRSRYHPGNEESAAWHSRFGFYDEPDRWMAQMRWRLAGHELDRHERLRHLSPEEEAKVRAECEHWKTEAARLEEADSRKFRAMRPNRRASGGR